MARAEFPSLGSGEHRDVNQSINPSATLVVSSIRQEMLSIGQNPLPQIPSQNLENKETKKFNLRKILHPKELYVKIFIRKDLGDEIYLLLGTREGE